MNKRVSFKIWLLILALSPVADGFAQTSPGGLVFDDEAYRASPGPDSNLLRGAALPNAVSLRAHCPTPGDQGNLATCVGWALANALTIERAVRSKTTGKAAIKAMRHSVAFIYNQVKLGDCQAGAKMSDGLKLLMAQGDCLASEFEPAAGDCTKKPADNHRRKAARYATRGYERLFDAHADPNRKIEALCAVLAQKQPVLIAVTVPADFKYRAVKDLDWRGAGMGHAMVAVGYDLAKKEFEILNSYGAAWGEGGFFHLNFYTLAANLRYAYRLVVEDGTAGEAAAKR